MRRLVNQHEFIDERGLLWAHELFSTRTVRDVHELYSTHALFTRHELHLLRTIKGAHELLASRRLWYVHELFLMHTLPDLHELCNRHEPRRATWIAQPTRSVQISWIVPNTGLHEPHELWTNHVLFIKH